MDTIPTFFVSHGAPTLILDPHPARDFLAGLAEQVGAGQVERPRAILAVTAHWTTPAPMLSSGERPGTIHDFGGFPDELYAMTYAAPGSPELAAEAARLTGAGLDPVRGFDHGTWVPLKLAWPAADIPVVQLSVQPGRDAAHHYALGQALRPLREQGVLIVASGSVTHNLAAWWRGGAQAWSDAFADWLAERVAAGDTAALLDWQRQGPEALRNHPTDEHFLPFFVALGAGGQGRRVHASADRGALRLDGYRFD